MTVSGLSRLGVCQAVAMCKLGHTVLGVDVDTVKVEDLSDGRVDFFEPGLQSELKKQLKSGRLTFSESHNDFSREADIHWLCMDVPPSPYNGEPNLNALLNMVDVLKGYVKDGAVLAGRRSVPVGFSHQLKTMLDFRLNNSVDFHVVWAPVFTRGKSLFKSVVSPSLNVFGAEAEPARAVLDKIYDKPVKTLWFDLPTVELLSFSYNTYLNMQSSFMNALSNVADEHRVNIQLVRKGMSALLEGYELPKVYAGHNPNSDVDLMTGFMFDSEQAGDYQMSSIINNINSVNNFMEVKAFNKAKMLLNDDVVGKNIVVLGAATKPNTDNIDNSFGVNLAVMLHNSGAKVRIHDVKALPAVKTQYPFLKHVKSLKTANSFKDADLVIVATSWGEYLKLSPTVFETVRGSNLLDLTNDLNHLLWVQEGWNVDVIGGLNL